MIEVAPFGEGIVEIPGMVSNAATRRLPTDYRLGVLRFRILGPTEVVDETGPLRLGGPRQRATLAILLLNANHIVSIERLAEMLYAGRPPVTAVTQVHRQISELRKLLGAERIRTESPGYAFQAAADEVDLLRFERSTADAEHARSRGDAARAVELLEDALGLWRGRPLAELSDPGLIPHVRRLEELQLAAHERLLEAKLTLGRAAEVVAEVEPLAAEHRTRESLRALQMLALYRSGRQAEALEVFRQTRTELVESFGIEPGSALRQLQTAILAQDSALDLHSSVPEDDRAILLLGSSDVAFEPLLATAEPLAATRELILARVVADEAEIGPASEALNSRRRPLANRARCAVFTGTDPGEDAARLANSYEVDLVLVDGSAELTAEHVPADLARLFDESQADVGIVCGTPRPDSGVFVPFGGSGHDWAALELGTWLAAGSGAELVLVGTSFDPRSGRRDASRLLAHAAMAAQRLAGVTTHPLLAPPSPEGLRAAVDPAGVVIVGLIENWRTGGIGNSRRALIAARAPVVLVHRGPRPGGLASTKDRTRFTWTIDYRQDVSFAVT